MALRLGVTHLSLYRAEHVVVKHKLDQLRKLVNVLYNLSLKQLVQQIRHSKRVRWRRARHAPPLGGGFIGRRRTL